MPKITEPTWISTRMAYTPPGRTKNSSAYGAYYRTKLNRIICNKQNPIQSDASNSKGGNPVSMTECEGTRGLGCRQSSHPSH